MYRARVRLRLPTRPVALGACAVLAAGAVGSGGGSAAASSGTQAEPLVYASSTDGGITGFDIATGAAVASIPTDGEANAVAFSPDGDTLYAAETSNDLA